MKTDEFAKMWASRHRDASLTDAFMAGVLYARSGDGKSIDQREEEFAKRVMEYRHEYPADMLERFVLYWTEHGERDRKMRFEKQTSYDIGRRLRTWYERSEYCNGGRRNACGDGKKIRSRVGEGGCDKSIFDVADQILQGNQ